MAHPLHEIEEEILKRLNVRDLIRYKTVCKSWSSLISDPLFIKAHLNHHYANDHNNEKTGHRRIAMSKQADYLTCQRNEIEKDFFRLNDLHLLGSSNGLVCVSPSPVTPTEILVINPSTREVKKVTKPQIPEASCLCWGFGYDSKKDDYKIVIGFWKESENCTCFQMFSLRSKVWKVVGEVNYAFICTKVGILCKGMLHWEPYDKDVIISFHLTDEEFLEIPHPHGAYRLYFGTVRTPLHLGIMEDCLCIFHSPNKIWVMKDFNNKSWEIVRHVCGIKYDTVHRIKLSADYIPNERYLLYETLSCHSRAFLRGPLYVESLVSPHLQEIEASNESQAKK